MNDYKSAEREVPMIGKIKKGKSFGGCVRYVMGKDDAKNPCLGWCFARNEQRND